MRLLLGIILGVCLTIGGAYLYDSHNALEATNAPASAPASAQRPMVNWDVVSGNWQGLSSRVRNTWNKLASR